MLKYLPILIIIQLAIIGYAKEPSSNKYCPATRIKLTDACNCPPQIVALANAKANINLTEMEILSFQKCSEAITGIEAFGNSLTKKNVIQCVNNSSIIDSNTRSVLIKAFELANKSFSADSVIWYSCVERFMARNTPKYLMQESNNDELNDFNYLFGVHIYSPLINSSSKPIGGDLSLEVLLPSNTDLWTGLVPTIEIGLLYWNDKGTYLTLPGEPSQTSNQKNILGLSSIGLRKYFAFQDNIHPFIGGLVGYSWEVDNNGDNSSTANLLCGLAFYPLGNKISLELRYGIFGVLEKNIVFSPVGEAGVTSETIYKRAFSLSVLFYPFGL